jgi:hypothetical protein
MSELITAVFAVSILMVAWMVIRVNERLSKLENKIRRLERLQTSLPGKVIGSQPESLERQEDKKSTATPS